MGKSTLLQLLQLAGGSTTAPQESRAVPVPEKALGILRRCGASRYGRPSPQEATEALVRVLDSFQAAPKILNLGSSSGVVPSTDDIALKMEERPIGFSQARDWSPYLRDAAWRPVFCAPIEALDAARRYLSCPTPSPPPGSAGRFLGAQIKRTFAGDGTYQQKRPLLLGLLRVRTWGRYRYMAAGGGALASTLVAPQRMGLRVLGVPLPLFDVRPGRGLRGFFSKKNTPPAPEAHTWCFADETLCVTRAADGSYGVWLRVG